LEDYAQRFDALFSSLAQRRGFREYLQGLLLPKDRNKTLTGLAGAEPITGAQRREVQRLQFFLSESTWDHQQLNDRRVRVLCQDPATAPNNEAALVIDDTGDRKDGTATAHVARQYLGSVGKIDNGIVAVTSLWADERCYWPVHAVPYTPASRLVGGERDPGFGTKPQLAVEDCFYGDNPGFTDALAAATSRSCWPQASQGHLGASGGGPHPNRSRRGAGLAQPEPARPVATHPAPLPRRPPRDLVAADATLGGWGPDRRLRLVVVTTDPASLPGHSSW
jgi:DDE superfamily endonuclease